MSIINEAAKTAIEEEELTFDDLGEYMEVDPQPKANTRLSDFLPDLSILTAKTGEGSIEDYINHPLNFKGSRGMAQMIRGFTGIAGELDYAIIDIALGAFQYTKEGKAANVLNDQE